MRGWVGVEIQDVTPQLAESFGLPEATGILIAGVLPGGPADRAGLRPGDVVTALNGSMIKGAADALELIVMLAPGDQVSLSGWREQASTEWTVDVDERPQYSPR